MSADAFNAFLEEQFDIIRRMMGVTGAKAVEYSRNNDRLHNFRKAALFTNSTPRKALWGMLAKHLVSIHDTIQDNDNINEEKLDDGINYLILLKALNREGLEWSLTNHSAPLPDDVQEVTDLDAKAVA